MDSRRIIAIGAAAAAFLAGAPSFTGAQSLAAPRQRPAQGLFDHSRNGDQSLDASVSLLGAYDDSPLALGTSTEPGGEQSGSYGSAISTVSYSKKVSHGELGISESSSLRYYPTLNDMVGVQHVAVAGLELAFNKTSLHVSQTFAYAPLFAFSVEPSLFERGVAEAPAIFGDQSIVKRDQRSLNSLASIKQSVGRRTNLTFSGQFQTSVFNDGSPSDSNRSIGGIMSRSVTGNLSLVAGYTHQEGTLRSGASAGRRVVRIHNVDIGVDFNRPIGRTRRTTIGFTTGSTAVQQASQSTEYRLTANARLNREIGRTWHTTAAYLRGAGFIQGFAEPFFADSVVASVGGTISQRMWASFAGTYSTGELGFGTTSTSNDTYKGVAQFRVALTRMVAVTGEYFYYHYRFENGAALPAGIPPGLNRQGVRFGLDLWRPLIR